MPIPCSCPLLAVVHDCCPAANWPGQSSAPFQVATLQLQTKLDLSSGDLLIAAPTALIWVDGASFRFRAACPLLSSSALAFFAPRLSIALFAWHPSSGSVLLGLDGTQRLTMGQGAQVTLPANTNNNVDAYRTIHNASFQT